VDFSTMRDFCASKPGAWPDWPWGGGPDQEEGAEDGPAAGEGHDHAVFKVGPGERGKIFAFLGATGVGVKAGRSREVADEWLDRYPGKASVMAYIGRSGWNDLAFDGIPDDELLEAVEVSYRLVVEGLPKRLRPDGWETA
jgi:predicted DNA-binding protein (MmcQ/YjbR family)